MPVSLKFHRARSGLVGCTVGLAPGAFVGAFGVDALDALHAASGIASQMNSIVEANPELAVLVPPPALLAMKAINVASGAMKSGATKQEVARTHPKVSQAVAQILNAFGVP